jgi:hypothetical protein
MLVIVILIAKAEDDHEVFIGPERSVHIDNPEEELHFRCVITVCPSLCACAHHCVRVPITVCITVCHHCVPDYVPHCVSHRLSVCEYLSLSLSFNACVCLSLLL